MSFIPNHESIYHPNDLKNDTPLTLLSGIGGDFQLFWNGVLGIYGTFIVLHNLVMVAKALKRVRQVDTFQRQLSNTSFAQNIQRMCTRQFEPKLVSRL